MDEAEKARLKQQKKLVDCVDAINADREFESNHISKTEFNSNKARQELDELQARLDRADEEKQQRQQRRTEN